MAAAIILHKGDEEPPVWGLVAFGVFTLVWIFRFLSEEKRFFRD
ncbi:hypothetical protein [Sphingorhabdus sp. Alg239-R122]|nr:hypothetical protein [Sphingorhabdus sp. Alg239-R122]